MKRDLKELIQELLEHIDNNPLTDEQIEKIEKWVEENKKKGRSTLKEIIYLDTVFVNSILAQMNKGLVTKLVNEDMETDSSSDSSTESTTSSGSMGINKIIAANTTHSELESETSQVVFSKSNKDLIETAIDDYSLDLLLNDLKDNNSIINQNYGDGDVIQIEGELTTYDFKQLANASSLEEIEFLLPDYDEYKKNAAEYNRIKNKNKNIPRADELKKYLSGNGWQNFDNLKNMSSYLDKLLPNTSIIKVNDALCIVSDKLLRVQKSQLSFMQLGKRKVKMLGICSSTIDERVPSNFDSMANSQYLIRYAPTTIINIMLGSFNLINGGDHIVRPIAIYFED
ncbi:DUF6414 family protein [Streptococcus pasteurianus]